MHGVRRRSWRRDRTWRQKPKLLQMQVGSKTYEVGGERPNLLSQGHPRFPQHQLKSKDDGKQAHNCCNVGNTCFSSWTFAISSHCNTLGRTSRCCTPKPFPTKASTHRVPCKMYRQQSLTAVTTAPTSTSLPPDMASKHVYLERRNCLYLATPWVSRGWSNHVVQAGTMIGQM